MIVDLSVLFSAYIQNCLLSNIDIGGSFIPRCTCLSVLYWNIKCQYNSTKICYQIL